MRDTTLHPVRWFALGVFASWYAGMLLSISSTPDANRWNSEVGVWMGGFGAIFMMIGVSLPFAGWLNWRRRGRPGLRPKFFVPLIVGALHPWVCILPLSVFEVFPKLLPASNIVVPLSLFGWPLILCEGMIRWTSSFRA